MIGFLTVFLLASVCNFVVVHVFEVGIVAVSLLESVSLCVHGLLGLKSTL